MGDRQEFGQAVLDVEGRLRPFLPMRVSDIEEREVKILDVEVPALVERLGKLGVQPTFQGRIDTVKVKTAWLPEGCSLKYRTLEGMPSVVILKGPKQPHPTYKVRHEITWEFQNPATMDDVVAVMEGVLKDPLTKHRTSYHVNQGRDAFHLDIDQYPDVPPVVEIEGTSDVAIEAAIAVVGLQGHTTTNHTAKELLAFFGLGDEPGCY